MGQTPDDCRACRRDLGTEMSQRKKPPFRADHVGSLLRPAALKKEREQRARGEISAAQLKEVEDREIERIIKKQEEVGLQSITDGEFRRSYPMIEHFKFVATHTKRTPKITIPAPSAAYGRPIRTPIDERVYPTLDPFFDDLGQAYKKTVRAFADAGCRYLQLDEVFIAMLCDPKYRQTMVDRGDDPGKLAQMYGDLINIAMSDIPQDMTITMHMCRGNYKSTYMGAGGYEAVQEILFDKIKVDGFFMEYDTARAGGFEPLRMLPKDRTVVLGLVTSKSGRLEPRDEIKRRIEEATKYVSLDQLSLSPQCGFASTEEGNVLSEEEQWAKLRMIVELSEEIWGKSGHHSVSFPRKRESSGIG